MRTYQLQRTPAFLLEPGDTISFAPIDAQQFDELDRAAAAGELVAERIKP